jgi:hypothetical protein
VKWFFNPWMYPFAFFSQTFKTFWDSNSQNGSCLKMFGTYLVRMCMNPKTFFWPPTSFCALNLGCEPNVKDLAKGQKNYIVQKIILQWENHDLNFVKINRTCICLIISTRFDIRYCRKLIFHGKNNIRTM